MVTESGRTGQFSPPFPTHSPPTPVSRTKIRKTHAIQPLLYAFIIKNGSSTKSAMDFGSLQRAFSRKTLPRQAWGSPFTPAAWGITSDRATTMVLWVVLLRDKTHKNKWWKKGLWALFQWCEHDRKRGHKTARHYQNISLHLSLFH